jgi:hypothetical protein
MRSHSVGLTARVLPHWGLMLFVASLISLPQIASAQQCDDTFCSCLCGTIFDTSIKCEDDEEEEEPKCSYGPCCCQPRKTLLQWSYGTSFSGGPPGMDEPLVSDRPDFTEASVTVGRGVAQVEMGYTFTLDRSGGERTIDHSYPEMLWRIGVLAEWLEFRIAYNHGANNVSLSGTPVQPGLHTDAENLYLGFKIALTPQEGILPEMAIMPQMSLEFGEAEDLPDESLPGVNWLYGWDINDFLSTGGSTQIIRAHDELDNYYAEFAQSWTVGYSLTDRLGAYTEWFMFAPAGSRIARTEHYADGGFTFLVNNNFQLDIRAGVGLNEAADDFFTGAGTVLRF